MGGILHKHGSYMPFIVHKIRVHGRIHAPIKQCYHVTNLFAMTPLTPGYNYTTTCMLYAPDL